MHLQVPRFKPRKWRSVSDDGDVGRICDSRERKTFFKFFGRHCAATLEDSVLQNEKTGRLRQDERTDLHCLKKNS
ncbi:Protein of unknown function [Gryllus bimaculatus]|nr:Protein of unknown function [Gryllus bimaculatus]